jgi:hypothetical protein
MMHSQPATLEPRSRPPQKPNRRRSPRKANNTNTLHTSLETTLQTLSLALLPITLLVLLGIIALGLSGNSWVALQKGVQPDQAITSSFSLQTFRLQTHLELRRPNVTVANVRDA